MIQESSGFWASADTVTSVLVNVSVVAAAVVAVIKFRVLHMLSRRYRSELQCTDYVLRNGRVIFVAEYAVHNTGERPKMRKKTKMKMERMKRMRRRRKMGK